MLFFRATVEAPNHSKHLIVSMMHLLARQFSGNKHFSLPFNEIKKMAVELRIIRI